jgi:cell division protein FtsL
LAVGLELLNIHLSGKLASDSMTVKKLQQSIAKLDEENQILNTKVLFETSFETISDKAKKLGFVVDHSYISLRNDTKLTYQQ